MFSLELNETQSQMKEIAAKFSKEVIAPGAIERDQTGKFPKEILGQMGELGFLGIMVDPKYDGSGMDAISYTIALEEFSKADASLGIALSVQNSLVDWIFEIYGTEEQKEKYLKPAARGEYLGAYCLSEPEAGSDARQIKTFAEKKGEKWILNGSKNWTSTGSHADLFIVFAQTDPELLHKGITAFVFTKDTPGLEIGKNESKMGMRSSDTVSLHFNNIELTGDNVIGEVGRGFYIAMNGLNGGRIGIASQSLGIAQGAFERSARYALERKTMGKPIAKHQLIQAKIAMMSVQIDAARLLIRKAAWLKDKKLDHIKAASHAKLYASTIANQVTKEAIQIHGGYGYTTEYEVERMYRDAKVTEIYEGTSEIQKMVIAREVFKKLI